jgi:hypothetical protein
MSWIESSGAFNGKWGTDDGNGPLGYNLIPYCEGKECECELD